MGMLKITKSLCFVIVVLTLTGSIQTHYALADTPSANAQGLAQMMLDIPTLENKEVLNLTFDDPTDPDKNIWRARTDLGHTVTNGSVDWEAGGYAKIIGTRNLTGAFALGGFYPALETSISFSVFVGGYTFSGPTFKFFWHGTLIQIVGYGGIVRCYVMSYNETGVLKAPYVASPNWGAPNQKWIHVTLDWYSNRTFAFDFSYDGGTIWQGWNKTMQNYDFDTDNSIWPSTVAFTWSLGTLSTYETDYRMFIDNVTQTIPVERSSIYAGPSISQYSGMGFDGPYNETITNALPVLDELGLRATWHFIPHYEGVAGYWTESDMSAILAADQEVGIHAGSVLGDTGGGGFTVYNASGINTFNERMALLFDYVSQYGRDQNSIVWTTLGNGYAWPYTDYVLDNHQSLGRKFWVHWYAGMGGWFDYYNYSLGAAERGLPFAGYNHKIGVPEDVPFDLWYGQVNTTLANGLNIVGLAEYWFRYAAPWYVNASTDSLEPLTFTAQYEGFNVWNEFELTIDLERVGLEGEYIAAYDLTDSDGIANLSHTEDKARFNASDGHEYIIPISCDKVVDMEITSYDRVKGTIAWTGTASLSNGTEVQFTIHGLDATTIYDMEVDGSLVGRMLSADHTGKLTWTYDGNWSAHSFALVISPMEGMVGMIYAVFGFALIIMVVAVIAKALPRLAGKD